MTPQLIRTILESDPTISPDRRAAILALLEKPEAPAIIDECSERQAATLLGVTNGFLCRWRLGKRAGAGKFPFSFRITLAGHLRYDRREIMAARDTMFHPGPIRMPTRKGASKCA